LSANHQSNYQSTRLSNYPIDWIGYANSPGNRASLI